VFIAETWVLLAKSAHTAGMLAWFTLA